MTEHELLRIDDLVVGEMYEVRHTGYWRLREYVGCSEGRLLFRTEDSQHKLCSWPKVRKPITRKWGIRCKRGGSYWMHRDIFDTKEIAEMVLGSSSYGVCVCAIEW